MMITGAIVATLLSAAQPPLVASESQACALAWSEKAPNGKTYSIRGVYFSDGMHGSAMDLPKCDGGPTVIMTGKAEADISAYHQAFQKACGSVLMGDHIDGVFTGVFSRKRIRLFGRPSLQMVNVFAVSRIDTKSLDLASITC